jgi:UPF0755 protein
MNPDKKFSLSIRIAGIVILILLAGVTWSIESKPASFPVGTNFIVDEGESLHSISVRLKNEHYITSALFFRMWVSFLGRDRHIQLGVYAFDRALPLGQVVAKLISGNPDAPLLSITIPEGSTSSEIASIIKSNIPMFKADVFLAKVKELHADGRLFPSTYYFLPSSSEEKIIQTMTETFDKKYAALGTVAIPPPLAGQDQVIVLASILEGEAKTPEDMKIVSGILLKRIALGMPLQVDVAKETYSVRGLPKNPINNPGVIALSAALHPMNSEYLYYLTDKAGIMHYSKTFEEHKRNIQKYLK